MFMTARYHLAVVSYDQSSGDLVTRAYGDVKVRMIDTPHKQGKGIYIDLQHHDHGSTHNGLYSTSHLRNYFTIFTLYIYHPSLSLQDRVGRPTEGRQLGIVDPECRVIALHLYAGLLKVVPLELDSGQEMKAFNIRLDNLYAVDLQFLHGFDLPTIAYLVEVS